MSKALGSFEDRARQAIRMTVIDTAAEMRKQGLRQA